MSIPNPSTSAGGQPALGPELAKAEARQASNLRVTTKAIDALYARIANAKRELDHHQQQQQQQQQQEGGASVSGSSIGSSSKPGQDAASAKKATSPKGPSSIQPPSSKGKGSTSKTPGKTTTSKTAAGGDTVQVGEGGGPQAMDLEGGGDGGGGGRGGDDGGGSGGGAAAAAAVAGILSGLAGDVANLGTLEAVGSENKNFHATISKLAKAAEKQFGSDVESVRRTPGFKEKALHTAIITHLYRRGAFRSAARFSEDSSASIPPDTCSQLVEMHTVLEALNKQNLAPAERWFEKRRAALEGVGSSLEFQLARLRFLRFLKSADPKQRREAMLYARERLRPVSGGHMRELKELMGSLLWCGNLEASPYSHLLSLELWARVKETVAVDGSRVSGLSRESILSVAFRAGVLALPTLLKMAAVVRGSNQQWDGMQELPLEVPLPPGLRYHSMFSCPVTRESSSMENPPVLLKCGHAVLRSSVSRLPRNGSRFKCPTCPMEQTESETMALTL